MATICQCGLRASDQDAASCGVPACRHRPTHPPRVRWLRDICEAFAFLFVGLLVLWGVVL